jgi:prophage maintenance system killer protein
VCFFHPFDDANGRAALLTMGFVLAREKVFLDESVPSACAGTPMMRSVHWRWLG